MIQSDSILTPKEVQICLVLQALVQELVVLVKQIEVLDSQHHNDSQVTL